MIFWKFLTYACFLCVLKMSCYTVFASDSEDESDTDTSSSTSSKVVKKTKHARSTAVDSESESDSDDEASIRNPEKKKKNGLKSVQDLSSMTTEERLRQFERILNEHGNKITTIHGELAYVSGGMTDFSKNIRTDLPLLVSGAASLFYLAIVGYQAGYLDLGTTLSIFVYSYTIFGMFLPKVSGMINTPLNKR